MVRGDIEELNWLNGENTENASLVQEGINGVKTLVVMSFIGQNLEQVWSTNLLHMLFHSCVSLCDIVLVCVKGFKNGTVLISKLLLRLRVFSGKAATEDKRFAIIELTCAITFILSKKF